MYVNIRNSAKNLVFSIFRIFKLIAQFSKCVFWNLGEIWHRHRCWKKSWHLFRDENFRCKNNFRKPKILKNFEKKSTFSIRIFQQSSCFKILIFLETKIRFFEFFSENIFCSDFFLVIKKITRKCPKIPENVFKIANFSDFFSDFGGFCGNFGRFFKYLLLDFFSWCVVEGVFIPFSSSSECADEKNGAKRESKQGSITPVKQKKKNKY